MRRALLFGALGAVLAYGIALYALTDWLEIDWRFEA